MIIRRTSLTVSRSVAGSYPPAGLLPESAESSRRAPLLLKSVLNNVSDLAVIEAFLQRDDQRRGYVEFIQMVNGLLADAPQVGPSQLLQHMRLKAVELQVDFEAGHIFGEPPRKIAVLGNADTVRVHHNMLDGAALAHVQDVKNPDASSARRR